MVDIAGGPDELGQPISEGAAVGTKWAASLIVATVTRRTPLAWSPNSYA